MNRKRYLRTNISTARLATMTLLLSCLGLPRFALAQYEEDQARQTLPPSLQGEVSRERLPRVAQNAFLRRLQSTNHAPLVLSHAATGSEPFTAEQLNELERLFATHGYTQRLPQDNLQIGYNNGFVIASPSGVNVRAGSMPFLMRINSWFQLRSTIFDSDGLNPDQNDIEFERLRLTFGGHAYTPDLKYFVQLDGDSDQGEAADFLDYYVTYDFGKTLFGWNAGRLGFKAGKWKLPFTRARRESGWKLEFTDRSIASSFFDINRSLGAAIFGQFDMFGHVVHFETALFNGFKTAGFRPVRSGAMDRNFGFSTRVYADVIGEWGKDGEPDLSYHDLTAVRAGSGFAYTRVDTEGAREFGRQRVVDSGATLASVLPAGATAYDVYFYAADVNVKCRGFSFHSEYYLRYLSNFSGASVPSLFDHGLLLQSGYFILPGSLEIATRWSRIVGDSSTVGAIDQSADEVAAALIWYIRGNTAKVTFDATHLNGAPIRDLALNILPGDDGWLFRTQVQIRF